MEWIIFTVEQIFIVFQGFVEIIRINLRLFFRKRNSSKPQQLMLVRLVFFLTDISFFYNTSLCKQ